MVNEGATDVTVLFSSEGGSTDDGMALFTYLRALPLRFTIHAAGVVRSMGIPAFLAAERRYASAHASFYFHDYTWTTPIAETVSLTMLGERTASLEDAIAWTKDVVRSTTRLTDCEMESLHLFDRPRMVKPAECVEWGLVSQAVEPKICAPSASTRPACQRDPAIARTAGPRRADPPRPPRGR
jgi:ATP-dependent protease ClpP protease subunit